MRVIYTTFVIMLFGSTIAQASNDINFSLTYDVDAGWGLHIRVEQSDLCQRESPDVSVAGKGTKSNFYTAKTDFLCEPDNSHWEIVINYNRSVVPVLGGGDRCSFFVKDDASHVNIDIKETWTPAGGGVSFGGLAYSISGDATNCSN